jgi:hypothetical protein
VKFRAPRTTLGAAVALALLVLGLNLNGLGAFFVGDDYDFLRLIGRADSLVEAAKLQFWGEWEPVWYVSWYLDMALWGFNPVGFHLTNVFWLAVAVVALFAVVRRVWPSAPEVAWAAALLFATHPLHDEAVTYLAARGHGMSLGLMLLALWAYVCARSSPRASGKRTGWIGASVVLAALAALAKETALILPVWIGTLEWLVLDPDRPRRRALGSGLTYGALFLLPAAASMALRRLAVGLESDKLRGVFGNWGELIDTLGEYLPSYALLGALPVPFGFVDYPIVERFALLGWLIVAAAIAIGTYGLIVAARRVARSPEWGVVALGLIVVITGLAPIFWADLSLRRRYLYVPTIGIVLIAGVVMRRLGLRFPRAATVLLLLAVVIGGAGTIQRNAVHRGAGSAARNLIETVRGAPIGEPVAQGGDGGPRIALVNRPARWGGDFLSGVYVFHSSDLSSAYRIFGVPQREVVYAMSFYHADDLEAEVLRAGETELELRFTFASPAAYRAALASDPADKPRGRVVRARRTGQDAEARTMTYRVQVSPVFAADPTSELYVYTREGVTRIRLTDPVR